MLITTVSDLSARVNQLEQSTLSNNIEIKCVPERKQESLIKIVKDLRKAFFCDLSDQEIAHCLRIAKFHRGDPKPRSIIVQFTLPKIYHVFRASSVQFNQNNKQNNYCID